MHFSHLAKLIFPVVVLSLSSVSSLGIEDGAEAWTQRIPPREAKLSLAAKIEMLDNAVYALQKQVAELGLTNQAILNLSHLDNVDIEREKTRIKDKNAQKAEFRTP